MTSPNFIKNHPNFAKDWDKLDRILLALDELSNYIGEPSEDELDRLVEILYGEYIVGDTKSTVEIKLEKLEEK